MKTFWFFVVIMGLYVLGSAQEHEDHVILVQLELNEKLLLPSYWHSYEIENKRIMLHVEEGDLLSDIESIEEDEDMTSSDCFIPSLKLIYKDYTYLISSLCNKVKKFENIKPYTAGDKELPCSVVYSGPLATELQKYQAIFFGPTYHTEYKAFIERNSSKWVSNSKVETEEAEEQEMIEEEEEEEEENMAMETGHEDEENEEEDVEEEDLEDDFEKDE